MDIVTMEFCKIAVAAIIQVLKKSNSRILLNFVCSTRSLQLIPNGETIHIKSDGMLKMPYAILRHKNHADSTLVHVGFGVMDEGWAIIAGAWNVTYALSGTAIIL